MKKYTRFNGGNCDFVEVTQLVIDPYQTQTLKSKVAVRIHSVDTGQPSVRLTTTSGESYILALSYEEATKLFLGGFPPELEES